MARSNGPGARPGQPSQQRPQTRAAYDQGQGGHGQPGAYDEAAPYDPRYAQPGADPYAQQQNPYGQQQPAGYAPDPNAQQQGQHDPYAAWQNGQAPQQGQQPQQGYQEPDPASYHQPDQGYGNPDNAQARGGYAPQFDPYVPQTDYGQQQAGQYAGQPQGGYANPEQSQGGYDQGYDPRQAQQGGFAQPQSGHPQQHDPHAPGNASHAQPTLRGSTFDEWSPTAPPAGTTHAGDYGAQYAAPEPGHDFGGHTGASAGQYVDPAAHQQGFGPAGGHAQEPGFGGPPGQALDPVYDDGYEDDEYEDEVDEPRSSNRLIYIAAALIGAIAIGGGLAYGYKVILGPAANSDGKPPVVTSGAAPTKVRPDNPGGRQFSHTDSKMMDRLGGKTGSVDRNPDGSKRVPTIVVGRDGSVRAPDAPPTPTGAAPANPVVSVPGLTVVDAFGSARKPRPPATAAGSGGPIVVTPPAKTQKPIVISKTSPSPSAKPPASVTKTAPKPPAAAPKPPAAKKPVAVLPVKPKKPAPPRAAPPAASTSTGNGYVAVLASVPVSGTSQMDTLKQFADIQQRYPNVLQNKTPEVREANLGAKGRYHRLLVGPPGSRTQASALCKSLKSAGYSSCWVTSF